MTAILDQFPSQSAVATAFRPRTTSEYVAFRIAQKLGEPQAAAHYVSLTERHSIAQMLAAFRRATLGGAGPNSAARFHMDLASINGDSNGHNGKYHLVAIRVERREVAAAVFHGERLEFTELHQLSSDRDKAISSAVSFISWVIGEFPVDSVALEPVAGEKESQRMALHQALTQHARENALAVLPVSKSDLFAAFGYPALQSRKELRQTLSSLWPILAGNGTKHLILDAVALGFYVQVERLFLY
jgi:hypothetical protein